MGTVLRNIESFLGEDCTPEVETSLNLKPNLVKSQTTIKDSDFIGSNDDIRIFGERSNSIDQVVRTHKRRRHNIGTDNSKKDSQHLLLRVLSMVLHGKKVCELPCSVAHIYNISESLCHDSNFASVMYQKEDEIFDNEVAPILRERGQFDGTEIIKEFIKSFTDWLTIIRRMRIVFTPFDESPSFRTRAEKRDISFWIIKFGRVVLEPLFCKYNEEDSLYRHFHGNRLMSSSVDLFVSTHMKDVTFTVSDFEENKALLRDFFDIVRLISDYTEFTEPHLNLDIFFQCAAKLFIEEFDNMYDQPKEFFISLLSLLDELENFQKSISSELGKSVKNSLHSICKGCLTSSLAKQKLLKHVFGNLLEFGNEVDFIYGVQEKYHLNIDVWGLTKGFIQKELNFIVEKQKHKIKSSKSYGSREVINELISFNKSLDSILSHVRTSSIALITQNVLKRMKSENFVAEALGRYIHNELIEIFHTSEKNHDRCCFNPEIEDEVKRLAHNCSRISSMIPGKKSLIVAIYENILRKELLFGDIIKPMKDKNDCIQLVREEFGVKCMRDEFGMNVDNSLLIMIHELQKSNMDLYTFLNRYKPGFQANFCCLKKENWTKESPGQFVQLPDELIRVASQYETSLNKQGFEWYYQLQRVTLNVLFDENNPESLKEIECSSYQAAVFLAFQQKYIISFNELQSITKMKLKFLEETLKLLVGRKMLLFDYERKTYEINSSFKSTKKIIKLHNLSRKKDAIQLPRTGVERDDLEMLHLRISCFITRKLKTSGPVEYFKLIEDILCYLVEFNVDFEKILCDHNTDTHIFIKSILDELTGEVYIRRADNNTYEYVP